MDPFIPYEKLSKRKKKELDKRQRGSWGAISPVTRRSENPKAYNRRKARKGKFDADTVLYFYPLLSAIFLTSFEDSFW
jgi:hypothetical protein